MSTSVASTLFWRNCSDQAAIQAGDYILAIYGRYDFTVEELTSEILKYSVGSSVTVRYRRYSTIYAIDLVLGEAN
jgi:S1-C subfamily serine protease